LQQRKREPAADGSELRRSNDRFFEFAAVARRQSPQHAVLYSRPAPLWTAWRLRAIPAHAGKAPV